jgi:hypothetical protein
VALGGLKFLAVKKSAAHPVDRTDYLKALEEYQQRSASLQQDVDYLREQTERQRIYMQESVMMGLDATEVCRGRLELSVLGADQETAYRMLERYRLALDQSEFLQNGGQQLQIEGKYLRELLSVTVSENGTDETAWQCLRIDVYHNHPEGANLLLTLVREQMQAVESQIRDELGAHTLDLVPLEAVVCVDNEALGSRQREQKKLLAFYESELAVSEEALSDLVQPVDPACAAGNPVREGLTFAVIGALLGGVLACGWGVLAMLFGDRLYSATDLQGRYDIKLLGIVAGKGQRSLVDGWLDRLEGRIIKDTAQNDGLIQAITRSQAGEGTPLLLGPGDVTAELAKRLELSGTEFDLKGLEDCDSVVLVAVCGESRYSQIGKTMELAADLGKRVIGCIVVEY